MTTGFGIPFEFVFEPLLRRGFGIPFEFLNDPARNQGFGIPFEFTFDPEDPDLTKLRHLQTPTGVGDLLSPIVNYRALQMNAIAAKNIFTNPSWQTWAILKFLIRCKDAINLSGPATLGFGKTNATFEFIPATALTGLTVAGKAFMLVPAAGFELLNPGESIFANITAAAAGSGGGQLCDVIALGVPIIG